MSLPSLLDQLVQEVTDYGDRQSLTQFRKRIERDLQNYRFPSTDSGYVAERYAGLVEKLHIKNQPEKAAYLQSCVDKLIKKTSTEGLKQKHLMFDVLSVLINVAKDPLNSEFQPSTGLGPKKSSEMTWESIVAEEPLTGRHWEQWESLSTDDDDEDTDLDEQAEVDNLVVFDTKKKRRERSPSNAAIAELGRANKYYLSHIEYDRLASIDTTSILQSQQYWMTNKMEESKKTAKVVEGIGMQAFSDPCALAPSLNELRLRSDDVRSLTAVPEGYIDEVDAIREVLFMIQGYPGVLFERVEQDDVLPGQNNVPLTKANLMFKVKMQVTLRHTSILTFNNLLTDFCEYGNALNELRHFKTTVCLSTPSQFGQTCQAFASHLDRLMIKFESKLSDLELIYSSQKIIEEGPSLLKLRQTLEHDLELFRSLNAIQRDIPGIENRLFQGVENQDEDLPVAPLAITVSLIDNLFHHLNVTQSSSQPTFSKLKEVFLSTVVPYGILMDDWIFEGSLIGDVASEFFVQRNSQINTSSSRFWRHGYQIRIVEKGSPYPVFLHSLVPRIFFAGKAVNFMLRMDISEVSFAIYSKLEKFSSYLFKEEQDNAIRKAEKATRPKISPSEKLLESHLPSTMKHHLKQKPAVVSEEALNEASNPSQNPSQDIQMQDLFRHSFFSLLERYVEPRYRHLAALLMQTLNNQAHLQRHLQCLASLFLMIEGDMMHKFSESIFIKMDEGKPWYDDRTVNALFLEACRDEKQLMAEDVHIEINLKRVGVRTSGSKQSLTSHSLSILESIIIHYQLPNPINNFIRRSTLQEYRKISTFVFQIKRAKRVMEQLSVFKGRFQNAREGINESMAKFYSLRLRLVWFVNTFHSYILTTILHSETVYFQRELEKLVNVDDIVLLHDDYVRKIVDRCLLNEKTQSIRSAVIHVLDMTILLSRLFKKYVQDPALRNFTNASVFMVMPPRLDSDDEDESGSLGSEDEDNNAGTENGYLESFEKGLSMIDEEYTRATSFITTSLDVMAKSSGLSWFEALAQSLNV